MAKFDELNYPTLGEIKEFMEDNGINLLFLTHHLIEVNRDHVVNTLEVIDGNLVCYDYRDEDVDGDIEPIWDADKLSQRAQIDLICSVTNQLRGDFITDMIYFSKVIDGMGKVSGKVFADKCREHQNEFKIENGEAWFKMFEKYIIDIERPQRGLVRVSECFLKRREIIYDNELNQPRTNFTIKGNI